MWRMIFLGAVLSICGSTSLLAQLGTGTLNGALTDQSGAVINGGTVTATNVATNESRTVSFEAKGFYSIPELSVGRYRLVAKAPGFGTATREGISLSVGAQLTLDIKFSLEAATSTVDVQATAGAQVNSTSGELSTLIDPRQIRELPLNGRNFEQLILLAPGAQPTPASSSSAAYGRSPSYSISGARPVGQAVLLDGANIQGFWNRGTGASIIGTSLGVEAIGEFQTLTGIYGAQFGGSGSVINAVTKSGTNDIHGSIYDFVRNSVFDARNYFDAPAGPPSFRRNQFGGSVGFPLRKDKTFGFVNYEGLRQQLGETNVSYVPDQNAHQGYLPCAIAGAAYTCGANGLAFVGVNSNVVPLLNLLPLPNGVAISGSGSGTYSAVADKPANENYVNARLDDIMNSKDTVSLRYVSDDGDLVDPFPTLTIAGFPEVSIQRNRYATIENRLVLSPALLNTTRFHFTRSGQAAHQQAANPTFSALSIIPGQTQYGSFQISSLNPLGVPGLAFGAGFAEPISLVQNKFVVQNDVYLGLRSHQLQIGFDLTRVQSNTVFSLYSGGQYIFPSLLFFLRGAPPVAVAETPGSDSRRDGREIDLSPYIQDDWKVSPRLSVNLGIRYEFVSNPVEVKGKYYALLNPTMSANYTQVPHAFASNPSLKNIDPRVGFSYTVFNGKTAIRGGFGVYHDAIAARNFQLFYDVSPPNFIRTITAPSFPTLFTGGTLGLPSLSAALLYGNKNTPSQTQFSLGVQQQLTPHMVLTASYVGNQGRHLFLFQDFNHVVGQLCPCTDPNNPAAANLAPGTRYFPIPVGGVYTRLNPAFSTLNYAPTSGTAHYNALQSSLVQQFSHGLQFQVNYTWSKSMDYSSISNTYEEQNGASLVMNPYNIAAEYGPSSFDIRHVGTGNLVYEFPKRANKELLSGWEVSLLAQIHTGSPYNVILGFDRENVSNSLLLERPNLVGNPNVAGPVAANPTCVAPTIVHTVSTYYNPCAFQLQPAGTVGNERRNQLYAAGLQDYDFATIKNTRFKFRTQELNAEFRAEFFNLFNHTNLGFPNFTAITNAAGTVNPAAGRVLTTATNSRQTQFSFKLLF